jgi:hypothetical protein
MMLAAGVNASATDAFELAEQVAYLVGTIHYASAQATTQALDVLLSGATTIVLVADRTFWADRVAPGSSGITSNGRVLTTSVTSKYPYAGFTNASRVWLGGVPCAVQWVSADGSLLAFEAPPLDDVCPAAATSGDCGYAPLRVLNVVSSSDENDNAGTLGADLSCPPFCPGLFPGTVPFRAAAPGSTLVPAVPQASSGLPVPVAASALQLATGGLFYTASCVGGGFTDPTTGACTNVSDPAFARCAFGAGDGCRPCPTGAVCPGGARAWPLPGYYTASESSGVVVACAAPATERCGGWNSSIGASACGPGYRPGSYGCLTCDAAFYSDSSGACAACPSGKGAWPVLQPLLIFAAALLAVAALLYGALRLVAKAYGGSLAGGVTRMLQFITWTITVVQVKPYPRIMSRI